MMHFPDCGGYQVFSEQRNLKKICHGIRNPSKVSMEPQNSLSLPDADFLENDKRNTEFFHEIYGLADPSSVVL